MKKILKEAIQEVVQKKEEDYVQCNIHGEGDPLYFTLRGVILHKYCFLCYANIPITLGQKDYMTALPTEE